MKKRKRKNYSGQEKVAILRKHLLEQEPVSKLCRQLNIQPTQFYRWQKEFFENGAAAFERVQKKQSDAKNRKISQLEEKIQEKNEVVAELMSEHIALKKSLGEL